MSVYLTETKAWRRLNELANAADHQSPAVLLNDEHRFADFSLRIGPLLLDYSRQLVTRDVVNALGDLAEELELERNLRRQFMGELVNTTEQRQALHTALRMSDPGLSREFMMDIDKTRSTMLGLATQIINGDWLSSTDRKITDVLHIGIGGSHLGQEMLYHALGKPKLRVHFVSNIDQTPLDRLLSTLDPNQTLVITASKSLLTSETLRNHETIVGWLHAHLRNERVWQQLIYISSNTALLEKHRGVHLTMPDSIGGRFSLWSAMGMPIALAHGPDAFIELLDGAHELDDHVWSTPPRLNAAMQLALLALWNSHFLQADSHVVLPYDYRLNWFVPFQQQLEMESNGKSIRKNGEPSEIQTNQFVWGGEETNAQHAFHQLLHQGTRNYSADFLLSRSTDTDETSSHAWVVANAIAQSDLMFSGHQADSTEPYRLVQGKHGSTLVVLDDISPHTLGVLIALYEHKTAYCGLIWDINSFDQWGVERGKHMAEKLHHALTSGDVSNVDRNTAHLITHFLES